MNCCSFVPYTVHSSLWSENFIIPMMLLNMAEYPERPPRRERSSAQLSWKWMISSITHNTRLYKLNSVPIHGLLFAEFACQQSISPTQPWRPLMVTMWCSWKLLSGALGWDYLEVLNKGDISWSISTFWGSTGISLHDLQFKNTLFILHWLFM